MLNLTLNFKLFNVEILPNFAYVWLRKIVRVDYGKDYECYFY